MFPNGEPGWHGSIPVVGASYVPPTWKGNEGHSRAALEQCNTFEDVLAMENEGGDLLVNQLMVSLGTWFLHGLKGQGEALFRAGNTMHSSFNR
ncbi:hypothetical protein Leryth_026926 [Lithospermum erythrorhizon]|uniref:Uncharacterized protein n=1 Tax=Lithospermum erythrorhizon TaxID=34254 RepID=A0AAV3S2C8_LITER|nr:hypothetical protein Leryth_026926 [Lithospermum erythrorhizon]